MRYSVMMAKKCKPGFGQFTAAGNNYIVLRLDHRYQLEDLKIYLNKVIKVPSAITITPIQRIFINGNA